MEFASIICFPCFLSPVQFYKFLLKHWVIFLIELDWHHGFSIFNNANQTCIQNKSEILRIINDVNYGIRNVTRDRYQVFCTCVTKSHGHPSHFSLTTCINWIVSWGSIDLKFVRLIFKDNGQSLCDLFNIFIGSFKHMLYRLSCLRLFQEIKKSIWSSCIKTGTSNKLVRLLILDNLTGTWID